MADASEPEDSGGGGEINLSDIASNIDSEDVTLPSTGPTGSDQQEELKSEVPADSPRISPASLPDSPDDTNSTFLECPICLQPCVHPVELPCRHIFCFLCIKGVAMQGPHGRCAICRSPIPHNVLTHPRLKDVSQLYKHVKTTSGFEWFYEARGGGWWQYDERSIQELEKAYEAGQTSCQLLIAGHLYEMDFGQMIQYRLNNRNLFRRMKRDVASAEKRGIAGIRLSQNRGSGGGDTSANPADGSGSADTGRRGRGGRNAQRGAGQGTTESSQPPSRPSTASGINPNNVIVLSESESDNERNGAEEEDSDDPEYLEEEEDMDLGEEEELGESVDEEEEAEDELRDGARAPTRRSDRSNSSTNPTPPPVANGISRNPNSSPNSNPNGRASRGSRADRTNNAVLL